MASSFSLEKYKNIKFRKNTHLVTISQEAIKLVSYAITNLSPANAERFVYMPQKRSPVYTN
jgi:hypothetical protein